MSWPSRTSGATLSGDGAKTLGVDLWDRDAIAAEFGWTWPSTDNNTTTTLANIETAMFRLPEWAEATAVISLTFTAFRDVAVSGNANFRLGGKEEGGSFVYGSTLNTALTTVYAPYVVTLAVPASPTWINQRIEFDFQAQRPASGVDADWQTGMGHVYANMRIAPI